MLGDDPAGADDVVIEINPRLTTSYLGLRRLARDNLADACGRGPRRARRGCRSGPSHYNSLPTAA